jgi:hypothetical protein
MPDETPIHSATRAAAGLRLRERGEWIVAIALIVVATVMMDRVSRQWRPTERSVAERAELLRSGTCVLRDSNRALIGKLIALLPPSRVLARTSYLIEDPQVRTSRTVDASGTRRVPCSSLQER